MSFGAKIEIEVRDLDLLKAAGEMLGLEYMRGQTSFRCHGDSSGNNLPVGFTARDMGHCEHALRVPGNPDAYEIGVVSRRDGQAGYHLLWDYYGSGGRALQEKIGQNGDRLKVAYSTATARHYLLRKGYRVNEHQDKHGNTVVVGTRG